jgi:hypothetical protein
MSHPSANNNFYVYYPTNDKSTPFRSLAQPEGTKLRHQLQHASSLEQSSFQYLEYPFQLSDDRK